MTRADAFVHEVGAVQCVDVDTGTVRVTVTLTMHYDAAAELVRRIQDFVEVGLPPLGSEQKAQPDVDRLAALGERVATLEACSDTQAATEKVP